MKLIYIAGPYRGKDAWAVEQNVQVVEDLGFQVACLGAVPVMPHTMYRHFNGTLTDRFWLDATLKLMGTCDGILLAPRWRKSGGSVVEQSKFAGPQFENIEQLRKWLDNLRAVETK